MRNLEDKVAVVTGAASGIGLGLAERCASEGMMVVMADVEEDALFLEEKKGYLTSCFPCLPFYFCFLFL